MYGEAYNPPAGDEIPHTRDATEYSRAAGRKSRSSSSTRIASRRCTAARPFTRTC
jgi:hypothetical protein